MKRRERLRVRCFFLPEELLHALHRNGDAQHKQRNGEAALQQIAAQVGGGTGENAAEFGEDGHA